MIPLETYLATHLRYYVWSTKRTLQAVAELEPDAYMWELYPGVSVQQIVQQRFKADWRFYELLAGEAPRIDEPLSDDYYSIFASLDTDYRILLRRFDVLASFLDDLELAQTFANTQVYLLNVGVLPKWQILLHQVSESGLAQGQIALLLQKLNIQCPDVGLARYFAEVEPAMA